MNLPWLTPETLDFPPVMHALDEPDGLLAAGGDLSPERLIQAYHHGIFPWYEQGQPILWWSPNPRTVIFPKQFHLSRSLLKALRRGHYRATLDTAFEAVIHACAAPRNGTRGTWITREMQEAYCRLHHLGYAHSVELWQDDQLVGGLYGIALGKVFYGESMFSRVDNGSKMAFAHLVQQLQAWDFQLIDCQVASDHLFTLGAEEIPREAFCQILLDCSYLPSHQPSTHGPWQFSVQFPWQR